MNSITTMFIKYNSRRLLFTFLFILLASCSTGGSQGVDHSPHQSKIKIIDHSYSAYDKDLPPWFMALTVDIESTTEYKDFYVFVIDTINKSKIDAQLSIQKIQIRNEISKLYKERFGVEIDDRIYSNLKKVNSLWAQIQTISETGVVEKEIFKTRTLFILPRQTLDHK